MLGINEIRAGHFGKEEKSTFVFLLLKSSFSATFLKCHSICQLKIQTKPHTQENKIC